jgi:hypothetical protein
VHVNNLEIAGKELDTLRVLYNTLSAQKNALSEAAQIAVQIKASEAWIEFKKGNQEKALELMKAAADNRGRNRKTSCHTLPSHSCP